MVKHSRGCIYRLTNTINSKKYIGKTVYFRSRMSYHKGSKKKTYISRAIQKYGWENFKQEIIIDDVLEEDLSNLEMSYIDVEDTMAPNGYNLTKGGEGISGFKHTPETIRKMHNGRYGCVWFNKRDKKWCVCGSEPERKYIGLYSTKEKAEEALNLFNNTGERMPSDRYKRGNIYKRGKRYEAKIQINKKRYTKTFGTVAECEEWFKIKKSI